MFQEAPFHESLLVKVREVLVSDFLILWAEIGVASGQPMHLGMLGAILKSFWDLDWRFVSGLGEGVPIGVDGDMPRCPLIFERKTTWALEELEGEADKDRDNYSSAEGWEKEIEKLFKEEEALGMMEVVTDEIAKSTWGKYIHIASLGVVVEKDKTRVVHDASHGVQVNHRIWTQDQLQMPGAGEIIPFLGEH